MGHNSAGENRRRRAKRSKRLRLRLESVSRRGQGAPAKPLELFDPGRPSSPLAGTVCGRRTHYFCTYFDRHYLVRGLALYASLARHVPSFRLHVLCLDEPTYNTLEQLNLPGVQPISLAAFERGDAALARARRDRSLVEYYFTCTPCLPLYVLNHAPDTDRVTYLDADLFFFRNPAPVYEEMGIKSILIIPHRFPPHLKTCERYGIYNVGLLAFRNDDRGRACLEWWRQCCLEWCGDRLEGGRFADQKYLDEWPKRFSELVVLRHKGANLAPWNVSGHRLQRRGRTIRIDADPLIFYHFHGLRILSPHLFDLGLRRYGVRLTSILKEHIYSPYLRQLQSLLLTRPGEGIGSLRDAAADTALSGPQLRVLSSRRGRVDLLAS